MTPFKALLISGAARGSTTLVAVIRTKTIALLLGPEGIGLLGILTSVQELGAQTAEGGLSHSAVRQIARARGTRGRLARIRRALTWSVLIMATIAAILVWVLRAPLSDMVMGNAGHAATFGMLSLGIALLMIFRWRQTVLCGFQKVNSHAWLTTSAAVAGTAIGIIVILLAGEDGVIWAVLAIPAAGVVLAPLFTKGLGPPDRGKPNLKLTIAHSQAMYRVGFGLMLSAIAVFLTPMILRAFLARDGLDQVGLYQAGLVVTMHLTGLVTAAVAMDYYPRISAVASQPPKIQSLMNQQAHLHLMLGGPMAILVAAFAPFILQVLFSDAFGPAASLLQLMTLGAILRLITVPAEIVLMAQAKPGAILLLQIVHQSVVLGLAFALWRTLGLQGFGLAYCMGQGLHLALVTWWNWRKTGIAWNRDIVLSTVVLVILGCICTFADILSSSNNEVIRTASVMAAFGIGALMLLRFSPNAPGSLMRRIQ